MSSGSFLHGTGGVHDESVKGAWKKANAIWKDTIAKAQSAVDGHHQERSNPLKNSMSTLTEELQKHYKGVENGSWHADFENRFEKISMSKTLNDEDDIEQFPVLYELAKETLLCDRNASRQKVTAGFANLKKVRRVYPTFCHGRLFSLVHIRFYSAAQESREFVQHRCASTCCHLNAQPLVCGGTRQA